MRRKVVKDADWPRADLANRVTACMTAAVVVLVFYASCNSSLAVSGKVRIAIVYLERIKPYESLSNGVVKLLRDKAELEVFKLGGKLNDAVMQRHLNDFDPEIVVCIGERAYQTCKVLGTVHIVSAYNVELLNVQNPFCILEYLQPRAKNVAAVVSGDMDGHECDLLSRLAAGYGQNLRIKKDKPSSWGGLFSGVDAVYLSSGVLIINPDRRFGISNKGSVVMVTNRSVKVYRHLEQRCVSELPKIDEVIDLDICNQKNLEAKLNSGDVKSIVCIGAQAYRCSRFMKGKSRILIGLETLAVGDDLSRWGNISGVSMFIEPQSQIEILKLLINKPIELAIPYNPENTEQLVLKALLKVQDGINLMPMPVSGSKNVTKVTEEAFAHYDGVWVIPDTTISVWPVQRLMLEETLRKKKLLVAMMHPYSKAGAAMAVSSTGRNDDALCDKVVELVENILNQHKSVGKIVSPPESVSLNVRTIRKLDYDIPASLMSRAEFVYGKE